MEETYQLIEGSPTLRDLDAENGFLWCPFGHSGRQNEPGILISRLDDGSYDVRLGTGFDSPIRFAIRDLEWSWMDMAMEETVELTFADDMALNDWIASETTATGAAWARCFNPYCGPDEKTLNTSEIIDTLRRFESPSYIVRGPIEDIESLPVGYYWCPDALDPDPSYNGYLLNVFAAFGGDGLPGKFFELFGGVTLNDVPSFGFDDGWDGSCLNRLDWQADYLPCVCHRGGQGENDRWEYEPTDDYRSFTRPADIPESIFDKLCALQGTTIEKVVNDPVTKFERSFREDIFNSQQNSLVSLTVLATLPLDAFLDASLSMICRGDREKAGTFTVKPGTYEPIMGIYDPINGCGGTAGIELDTDFDIDPRDIKYTMMEPRGGKWESDRIDLYTPQDCFGFFEPFAGRIEYSEKKPKIAAKAKPDPADLGRRASVAAGATIRDGVDGGGIKL